MKLYNLFNQAGDNLFERIELPETPRAGDTVRVGDREFAVFRARLVEDETDIDLIVE